MIPIYTLTTNYIKAVDKTRLIENSEEHPEILIFQATPRLTDEDINEQTDNSLFRTARADRSVNKINDSIRITEFYMVTDVFAPFVEVYALKNPVNLITDDQLGSEEVRVVGILKQQRVGPTRKITWEVILVPKKLVDVDIIT